MTAGFASIAGGVMAASRQTFSSLCKYGGFLKWGLPKIINFSIGFSIINHPFRGTAILRNFHMHTESTIWGCVWKRDILQLEFPLVRYGPMMSDQVKKSEAIWATPSQPSNCCSICHGGGRPTADCRCSKRGAQCRRLATGIRALGAWTSGEQPAVSWSLAMQDDPGSLQIINGAMASLTPLCL